jgi:FixJ family two-component response regulator
MVREPGRLAYIRSRIARSGMTVWTSSSANIFCAEPHYKFTACLVIDMPGIAGLEELEALRSFGISTPTILLADAGEHLPADRLRAASALDVLERPLQPRKLLSWIEGILAALALLVAERERKGPPSRRAA